jgi:hypothetical protein
MATVDPEDDGIRRYVVRRYTFEPERGERRHRVVAAFDNEPEYRAFLTAATAELQRRLDGGTQVDPREHYSGMILDPGHRQRARDARFLRRATQRRALAEGRRDEPDLPPNSR